MSLWLSFVLACCRPHSASQSPTYWHALMRIIFYYWPHPLHTWTDLKSGVFVEQNDARWVSASHQLLWWPSQVRGYIDHRSWFLVQTDHLSRRVAFGRFLQSDGQKHKLVWKVNSRLLKYHTRLLAVTQVETTKRWQNDSQDWANSSLEIPSLGTRPSKNRKGGSGTSAGVEVYTAEC